MYVLSQNSESRGELMMGPEVEPELNIQRVASSAKYSVVRREAPPEAWENGQVPG
jgi:hypothetical protein